MRNLLGRTNDAERLASTISGGVNACLEFLRGGFHLGDVASWSGAHVADALYVTPDLAVAQHYMDFMRGLAYSAGGYFVKFTIPNAML